MCKENKKGSDTATFSTSYFSCPKPGAKDLNQFFHGMNVQVSDGIFKIKSNPKA
jgi:hypothetical protein